MSRARARGVVALLACLVASAPGLARAEAPRKFALAVFHFNIQYVVGGLIGSFIRSRAPVPAYNIMISMRPAVASIMGRNGVRCLRHR